MRSSWFYQHDAEIALRKVQVVRIQKIKEKKDDTYKQIVMKRNGIDPMTKLNFKVYDIDDFVGIFLAAARSLSR